MSKKFIKGNVYVFSSKKYKAERKRMGKYKSNKEWSWASKVNGNLIYNFNNCFAECGNKKFGVVREWCKCIENNN